MVEGHEQIGSEAARAGDVSPAEVDPLQAGAPGVEVQPVHGRGEEAVPCGGVVVVNGLCEGVDPRPLWDVVRSPAWTTASCLRRTSISVRFANGPCARASRASALYSRLSRPPRRSA
ncbi:hypothetical protein SVIO_009390 [Streptomyces violaceusniger]|uniref:Uncharacterized protein n=1 Tax=Streptomyces violaceusniger TaxID=68280 RepID=A0A4D4KTU2_STRVO|nr:hypothetical protein SVIO_009390 [Streptomyces violaceusniger]